MAALETIERRSGMLHHFCYSQGKRFMKAMCMNIAIYSRIYDKVSLHHFTGPNRSEDGTPVEDEDEDEDERDDEEDNGAHRVSGHLIRSKYQCVSNE